MEDAAAELTRTTGKVFSVTPQLNIEGDITINAWAVKENIRENQ